MHAKLLPIEAQSPVDDGGPSTAVGLAPAGAEAWHHDRTARRGARDGGPSTEASAPFDFDDDEDEAVDSATGGPGPRRIGLTVLRGRGWQATP